MNRFTLGIALTFVAGTALVFAQNKTGIEFKSKSGDFSISNISDQLFEGDPANNSVDFEFSGNPLQGRSNSQKLSFTATKATGQIRTGAAGTMYLLTTTLSGNVSVKQNPGTSEEVTLTSPSLTLKESPNRTSTSLTFPSALTISANDPNANLKAASGVVTLSGPANGNRILDQATLRGSVTATAVGNGQTTLTTNGLLLNQRASTSVFQLNNSFKFTNNSRDASGKPRTVTLNGTGGTITTPDITKASKGRPITNASIKGRVVITFAGSSNDGSPLNLTASGDRLTMDSKGEILLIGNVKIEGGGLDYQSDGESQTIYIQVDENMKPLKYGARGNPAKVNIKPDGGGN